MIISAGLTAESPLFSILPINSVAYSSRIRPSQALQ